ncbi:leptin b isoform X1 [Danio rerio]|uniref:Leptin n=2 Tax=Danio rerio TaxID=7955 RepID=C4WYH6_DANRE|nr:leptin b precursor [Danio rerio]CAP15930.1 leptin-b [Danio rerio]|eukprot:NP_001025357.2 leptin b precursor [Danio rerio]
MKSSMIFCLLISSLVAVSISRPTAPEDRIRIIARTTISRIKKIKDEHFQMSPEIDFGPDIDNPIDGLSSVLSYLSYLQLRLHVPPAQHLQQVQIDLETLLRTLEELAVSQGCPLPNPETPVHKEETAFPVTSNYLHLLELQRFLEKLCLNIDKLKYCKDTDVAETFIL